jgi:hypothetical protein
MKKGKEFAVRDLTFFPALAEHTVLVQRDWLSWSVFHRPHPEDRVCWANAYTSAVRDTSFWIKDERLTPLPSFDWFYPENVRAEGSANLYTECTANASLLIDVWKYSNWHL